MSAARVRWRMTKIATQGVVTDTNVIARHRLSMLPPTAFESPTTHVLDITGMIPSPGALLEFVIPLGQQIRGGMNGEASLILATADEGVAETVRLVAQEHQIPLFLSTSTSWEDVERAQPAGKLTQAEVRALNGIRRLGGFGRSAQLAEALGIEPSAAHNRLEALAQKGYLFRLRRASGRGVFYVDPRTRPDKVPEDEERPAMRSALMAAGITSNPYDRSPLKLEGEAAERVAEILRRREKAR